MEFIIFLIFFFWIPYILVSVEYLFKYIYIWQTKEYRKDRMVAFLKYGDKNLIPSRAYFSLNFVICIFAGIFIFVGRFEAIIFPIFYFILQNFLFHRFWNRILKRKVVRPKISLRNVILMGFGIFALIIVIGFNIVLANGWVSDIDTWPSETTLETEYLLVLKNIFNLSVALMSLLNIFYFTLINIFVQLTEPLARYKRGRIIRDARTRLEMLPKLKTVGITGSFGKTSTKEILYKILKGKYSVVKTPGNKNTDIGIAQTIISDVERGTDILIAEMGAYCSGEILNSTKLLPLDVAVITVIGKCHLDIFGSIKNIERAKFEITRGLKNEGTVVLNMDDSRILKRSKSADYDVIGFSQSKISEKDSSNREVVNIFDVVWTQESEVNFTISYKKEICNMTITLVGKHNIANVLAAISVAIKLGMNLEEIKTQLEKEPVATSHFNILNLKSGGILIDNSYNSNPSSFRSSLEHLRENGNRYNVLVTKGIVEMGRALEAEYEELSELILDICNVVLTSDSLLFDKLKEKGQNRDILLYFTQDSEEINKKIKNYLNDNSTILIEGRVNESTYNLITEGVKD